MKSKLVRRILAVGLATMMAVGTVGCGSSNDSSDKKDDAATDNKTNDAANDKKDDAATDNKTDDAANTPSDASGDYENCTLTISWWGGETRHEATQQAIEAFEKAYPGITVESTFAAWDGWEEKMATAFVAGTAQDVNQINWNWITQYDADGSTFLDLNQYADTIDMSQIDSRYLEMCQINNTQAALPVSMTGRIFYWDKTSFDEVGIAIPTSYQELLAAGKAFQEHGEDYYPLAMGEYDRTILMVYYLECKYGKDWVADGKLQYSQEEIEEGLKFIDELEDNHVIPTIAKLAGDGAGSLDQNQNWIDGHYAGIFEWDSSASKFSKAAEGREIVVGDYFSDFGTNKGGFVKVSMCWAVNAKTAHPKEAAMLVEYLMNNTDAAEILKSERGIPVSKVALDTATSAGLLDAMTAEANGKVVAWCSNSLDPFFEDSRLKNSDGVYYDVMSGLSYNEYDTAKAAQILIDGVNSVIQ